MKGHFTAGLVATILSGLVSFPVKAEIVTWSFTAHINSSDLGVPPIGTDVSGSFSFTTTPVGTVSAGGTHAEWNIDTITNFHLNIAPPS
jgi:hypothetical protein